MNTLYHTQARAMSFAAKAELIKEVDTRIRNAANAGHMSCVMTLPRANCIAVVMHFREKGFHSVVTGDKLFVSWEAP